MNVATSTTNSSTISSTNSTKSTNTNSTKNVEKSFDEEIKAQETEQKSEETEEVCKTSNEKEVKNETSPKQDDKADNDEIVTSEMLSGNLNFTDFKYHNESQSLLSQNIQSLLDTKNLMSTINSAQTIDYDTVNMSNEDAEFFVNLVQNNDMSNLANQLNEAMTNGNANAIQQNIKVSSVLMEKLADSMKTNQPFRIDFDKDVSIIIKVNKDGSISANFIPGDKAVEQYLRNNISYLKQRFDEENLSYSELSYSQSKNQQRQKNKKENDNE